MYSQDCPSRYTNINFTGYVLSMQRGTPVRDALIAETNQPCIVSSETLMKMRTHRPSSSSALNSN